MKTCIPAFAACMALLGTHAQAQSLAEALRAAYAYSPALAVARAAVDAAPALRGQAGAIPNPEIALLQEGRDGPGASRSWQINQPIELGGKRSARIAAAERTQALAEAELARLSAELRADVIAAWHEQATGAAAVQGAQEGIVLAQRTLDVAARRVAAGKVSPVEEAKARLALAGARIDALQASSDLAAARAQLQQLTGQAPGTMQDGGTLAGVDLPELAPEALLSGRFARSPMRAKAQAEASLQAAQVQLERSRQLGDVTLSAGVKRETDFQPRRQQIIGLSLPIPLFDRNQGKLKEALLRADAAASEERVALQRLDSDYALARTLASQRTAEAREVRDTILPAARQALDAATRGFEYGKFSFIDVLDAQRTLQAAQSQYIRAQREAWRAHARLERLLGAQESKDAP